MHAYSVHTKRACAHALVNSAFFVHLIARLKTGRKKKLCAYMPKKADVTEVSAMNAEQLYAIWLGD